MTARDLPPIGRPQASLDPTAVERLETYQEVLAAAERRGTAALARAFEEAPPGVGVHEIDLEARVLRINDEALRTLGYEREAMVGHPVLDFIVMSESAQRAITRKFSENQMLKPFVRTFMRADGSAVTLILLDRHVRDAGGHIVGLRTVSTAVAG